MHIIFIYFRDGTLRIWSCGKGKCLEPPISIDDVVNCCDIIQSDQSAFLMTSPAGDSVGKKTLLVIVFGQDKYMQHQPISHEVNSICFRS